MKEHLTLTRFWYWTKSHFWNICSVFLLRIIHNVQATEIPGWGCLVNANCSGVSFEIVPKLKT